MSVRIAIAVSSPDETKGRVAEKLARTRSAYLLIVC